MIKSIETETWDVTNRCDVLALCFKLNQHEMHVILSWTITDYIVFDCRSRVPVCLSCGWNILPMTMVATASANAVAANRMPLIRVSEHVKLGFACAWRTIRRSSIRSHRARSVTSWRLCWAKIRWIWRYRTRRQWALQIPFGCRSSLHGR